MRETFYNVYVYQIMMIIPYIWRFCLYLYKVEKDKVIHLEKKKKLLNTYSSHASGIDLGSENTQMNQTNNFLVPPKLQRLQP